MIYNFSSLHFPFYFLALSNRFFSCCVFMIKASNKKSFKKKKIIMVDFELTANGSKLGDNAEKSKNYFTCSITRLFG